MNIERLHGRERPALMTWVPVRGEDGRVRMEMRWQVGAAPRRRDRTAA